MPYKNDSQAGLWPNFETVRLVEFWLKFFERPFSLPAIGDLHTCTTNLCFTIIVLKFPCTDLLIAVVYKSMDNKNDRRCSGCACSMENKANSARTFSML